MTYYLADLHIVSESPERPYLQYGLNFHFHADDTQLYLSFNSKATGEPMHSLSRVQSCISDITNWMASNKLMLNSDKTEILVLNACHRASSFTVVYYSSP